MEVKNIEIAEILKIDPVNVSRMKKNDPTRFELIKVGVFCLKNNITSKDLRELAQKKREEKSR